VALHLYLTSNAGLWHKDRDVVTLSYAGLPGMMMAIS
jgi:hypothetical protein